MKHPVLFLIAITAFSLGLARCIADTQAQSICEQRFSADTCHTLLR